MRLTSKLLLRLLILLGFILIGTGSLLAADATGTATKYTVRMTRVDLWNGSAWVTVFNGTSDSLDIASISSSGIVGNFLSGLSVPDGTYTKVKVWPATTFTINGSVYYSTDGNTYYPTASVSGTSCTATTSSGSAADAAITISSVDPDEHDFSATPITVTDGTPNKKVRVSFNVASALGFTSTGVGTGVIYPQAPTVTQTVVDN